MRKIAATLAFIWLVVAAGPAAAQALPLAGPHLDGTGYTELRAPKDEATIIFETSGDWQTANPIQKVVVGSDFVYEQAGNVGQIFDFRFRRMLRLDASNQSFANESLYGHVETRFKLLQNNLGTAGMGIAAGLFEPHLGSAIRYVSEHSNGIAYPQPVFAQRMEEPQLILNRTGQTLTGSLGGTQILTVELSESKFPSDAHARTFRAWLIWSGRMHPKSASAITDTGLFPAQIKTSFPADFLKLNPSAGALQQLEFKNISATTNSFKNLNGWKAETPAWSPYFSPSLANLMVSAARGSAPGGPKSDDEFVSEFRQLNKAGQHLDAVLLALHASHPYDGCGNPAIRSRVCGLFSELDKEKVQKNRNIARLFGGFGLGERKEYRKAAEVLIPLRSVKIERPDILAFSIANMVVEAKNAEQLNDALTDEFNQLAETFERALAVDPYDPARYRDIYNYLFAAVSSIEEHYQVNTSARAVIDLARALPDRRMPRIITQINEVDARIAEDFSILLPKYQQN